MEYSRRNTRAERRRQYGASYEAESVRQRSDDLRRNLILKYALHPENYDKAYPRNMWWEISEDILNMVPNESGTLGIDIGTSGGYFPEMLYSHSREEYLDLHTVQTREHQYQGQLLAIDYETGHFGALETDFRRRFPSANITFASGNAERLNRVRLQNGELQRINTNTFDFATVLNVLHHTGDQMAVINETHRRAKPDAIVAFMGRGKDHMAQIWQATGYLANGLGAVLDNEPFYYKYDFQALEYDLKRSPKFEIIKKVPQCEYLWIPDGEEGWTDVKDVIYSILPETKVVKTNQPLEKSPATEAYLDEFIHPIFFRQNALYHEGYFNDLVMQMYFICRVIK